MINLNLKITGLTLNEQYELLKKIDLIKDHVYPSLNVEFSRNDYSSNYISVQEVINDDSVALELFRCFKVLDFNDKDCSHGFKGLVLKVGVKFDLSLDYHNSWV